MCPLLRSTLPPRLVPILVRVGRQGRACQSHPEERGELGGEDQARGSEAGALPCQGLLPGSHLLLPGLLPPRSQGRVGQACPSHCVALGGVWLPADIWDG